MSVVLLHQSNKLSPTSCLLYRCVAFCPPGIFLKKAQRAVQRVWRPTRPTSLWRGNLSASWEAPSITSVSPESTGRTACWRWKPVASILSRRRLPLQQTAASPWCTFRLKNEGCRISLTWHSIWMFLGSVLYFCSSLQICAVEPAWTSARGVQLWGPAGHRVRLNKGKVGRQQRALLCCRRHWVSHTLLYVHCFPLGNE